MKKIVIALAAGMLVGSATTALAATDLVQATITKLKVVVNGKEQKLNSSPLVVKGTTYLPVREVAGLLGAGVDFDQKAATIKINDGKDGGKVNSETQSGQLTFREVVEILHKKYPDKEIYLTALGELTFGNEKIQLPFTIGEDQRARVDAEYLISLKLLQESDIQ